MRALNGSRMRKIKTHGGKWYFARPIIKRLPDHQVYVEPFAGGLSVLLNKPPCAAEVASDVNEGLIGCYRVLRDRTDDFLDRVASVEYDAETFDRALGPEAAIDPLEAAVLFLVRRQFSRGGMGQTFAWSDRKRGGQPGDRNAWETFKRVLPETARRLRHVKLLCQNATQVALLLNPCPHVGFCEVSHQQGVRRKSSTIQLV